MTFVLKSNETLKYIFVIFKNMVLRILIALPYGTHSMALLSHGGGYKNRVKVFTLTL